MHASDEFAGSTVLKMAHRASGRGCVVNAREAEALYVEIGRRADCRVYHGTRVIGYQPVPKKPPITHEFLEDLRELRALEDGDLLSHEVSETFWWIAGGGTWLIAAMYTLDWVFNS